MPRGNNLIRPSRNRLFDPMCLGGPSDAACMAEPRKKPRLCELICPADRSMAGHLQEPFAGYFQWPLEDDILAYLAGITNYLAQICVILHRVLSLLIFASTGSGKNQQFLFTAERWMEGLLRSPCHPRHRKRGDREAVGSSVARRLPEEGLPSTEGVDEERRRDSKN